jgi:nucleotidyltransferase substrate binding protein (TIGR01987 family)
MELNSRLEILKKALGRLEESLNLFEKIKQGDRFYDQFRDSVIQRLEFSADIFWKCLKDYIFEKHQIKVISPKTSINECFNLKIIDNQEAKIFENMMNDRNEASHRYDETMAELIAKNAKKYHIFMVKISKRLSN